MEPRKSYDPLQPMEPPSPFRPVPRAGPRDDEVARILREILDRLTGIVTRIKSLDELLKTRR